jgi:hypothetical protein
LSAMSPREYGAALWMASTCAACAASTSLRDASFFAVRSSSKICAARESCVQQAERHRTRWMAVGRCADSEARGAEQGRSMRCLRRTCAGIPCNLSSAGEGGLLVLIRVHADSAASFAACGSDTCHAGSTTIVTPRAQLAAAVVGALLLPLVAL